MKKLLNTLYITSPDKYLSLDGQNVVIYCGDDIVGRLPLHNLESIVTLGYTGASPALMGACVKNNISLCFLTSSGRFLARVTGEANGNVILRRQQYRLADDVSNSQKIAKNIILGKVYNSRMVIERATRDYPMRVDLQKFKEKSQLLYNSFDKIKNSTQPSELRGLEGECATVYFSVFDDLILQQKESFFFNGRNKRPPLDNVNAMLSFAYTLLSGMCASALETVGLDSYVGFFHTDRPGRTSLALDIVEELRSVFADRFVLSMINKRIVNTSGFTRKENGAVIMDDDTRKAFLSNWQQKKQEIITHPYLNEKVEWGVVPFVQAMLLARYIRGDIDEYPPFLYK